MRNPAAGSAYAEIAEFVQMPVAAPEITLEPLATKEFRLVGQDLGRIDVPSKVDGSCRSTFDVQVPGADGFRDALDVSRRVAQLLLERYDADGLTRRVGDERVLRRAARE